jgi:hypothetical protein
LILFAALNDVSPILARVFSITDDRQITDLHDAFLSMLGWQLADQPLVLSPFVRRNLTRSGLMFWLTRKKLSGSYVFFKPVSPYALTIENAARGYP